MAISKKVAERIASQLKRYQGILSDARNRDISESEEQAFAAVTRLPSINRRNVRAAFEQRFTAGIMAHKYLDVYAGMLQAHANEMRVIKTIAEATYELGG